MGDDALVAAIPLWFTGQATPEACELLFAALIKRGDITVADRRARLRLANEAGNVRLAQAIGAELPGKERIAEREFADVNREPLRALEKGGFIWSTGGGRELALFALERAARTDAGATRSAWVKWRDRLPEADRKYGNARLAYYAARQLNPAAQRLVPRSKTTWCRCREAQAWQVRAALRALAWGDVLATIDAMPDAQRQESAWRYWRARALGARGRQEESTALLTTLSSETNFYGVLSAEALGQRFAVPPSTPLAAAPAAVAAFAARPDVQRAVKLAELDMRPESQREWYYIVRGLPDDTLLLAADYARRVGLYDRAINAADRTHEPSRLCAALPRAVPHGVRKPRRRAHDIDVATAVRHRAAGVALHHGHRLVGRCRRADAVDAGHGALGRQADGSRRLSARRQIGDNDIEYAVRRLLFQVLAGAARPHAGARGRCV